MIPNWWFCGHTDSIEINIVLPIQNIQHSDLNDQNSFHSTIDAPPGVPGVSKNLDNQTEVHFGKLES